ncbi:MAG TPA: tripartite tricarboxylate transporter substrate binding protein [Burkholderiales bacterium]|jgi:tripartite-type tricarboxylate transporter receptor subunit TctC
MSMVLCRSILITTLALGSAAAPLIATAQSSFPAKTVRIIVPFSPGGASDALPRLLGSKLADMWAQQVIIDNRPGAAANIGMELGAKAAPDGYTLTSGPVGNLAVNPHMYKLSYDVFKDFTPITMMGTVENGLVVHPSIPAKSVKELIALLKSRPGELTYASGGVGTQAHMAGELFKAMTGTDMTHVAYKGVGASVTDLLGGHIAMIFAQIHAVSPHIQAGKLRALGVASLKRSAALPNVPTIAEAGNLPGFESVSWYALIGPTGMPPAVVTKIQSDSAKVLHSPELREKLAGQGVEPGGGTPDQLRTVMRADYDRYGTIIRKLGIKAD